MSYRQHGTDGQSQQRQWMNLFEISNLDELQLKYRLLRIDGLPRIGQFHKQINLLVNSVRYAIRNPVSIVWRADKCYLAIPDDSPDPKQEWPLTPHVARLVPEDGIYTLDLGKLDGETRDIGINFLGFALRGPLMRDQGLWGRGRANYEKTPINVDHLKDIADIYPGFVWSLVPMDDGRIFVAVDVTFRYVDRAWATERLDDRGLDELMHRHFLYHFGPKWYIVQLWGLTGQSISQQTFQPHGQDATTDVFTYTQENCGNRRLDWIQNLDPESPAIIYRYPGNELQRYGALALCKQTLGTSDRATARLHRYSILKPRDRLSRIMEVVGEHFQMATLSGRRIHVQKKPLEVNPGIFQVPALQFGNNRVLSVGTGITSSNVKQVSLERLGRERMKMILSPKAGLLDKSTFDAQFILLPLSAPRGINEDFERHFKDAMRAVSGKKDYQARRVLYDDRGATSLRKQVKSIERTIRENEIRRGYALLVLPDKAHSDLHNYIKRELWPDLQFQCVTMTKVRGYYERTKDGEFYVPKSMSGRYKSYLRNCALAMLVVNRKWAWALDSDLHYDMHIGIDVLNRVAGVTIIAARGRHIIFQDFPSQQKERLPASQTRTILLEMLRGILPEIGQSPKSIIVHRDGRVYESELKGLRVAIQELVSEGTLHADILVGVVAIRKSMMDNLRLFEGSDFDTSENPTIGSFQLIGQDDGIICTTGRPFRFPGTAKPLRVHVEEGNLNMTWVLEDVFSLSQLNFTAPDKCVRLPATIKIADDFLAPIASSADEDEALYGEELSGDSLTEEDDIEQPELTK